MKTTTSITIDVDLLIQAKKEIPNISAEFNTYLKHRLGMDDERKETNMDILKAKKTTFIAELNRIEKNIKKLEADAEEELKNKPTLVIEG